MSRPSSNAIHANDTFLHHGHIPAAPTTMVEEDWLFCVPAVLEFVRKREPGAGDPELLRSDPSPATT